MTQMFRRVVSTLIALAVLTAVSLPAAQAQQVTDEMVGKSIQKIKAYLYKNQDQKEGTWEHLYTSGHVGEGGATVIVVTALLASGESSQNPQLKKAIDWLREKSKEETNPRVLNAKESQGKTYVVGLRAHVWGALPEPYMPLLEAEFEWLIGGAYQDDATFTYGHSKGAAKGRYDHSCTQYGILGLWECAKRGIRVSQGFWEKVEAHFIANQQADGGWPYVGGGERPSTDSMTTAGVTALLTARQELYPQKASDKINKSIEKGLARMDKTYSGGEKLYTLYGVERVALASGWRYFNKKDWYRVGASTVMRKQSPAGNVGNLPDTCFALMFLARGRHPVWVTKLKLDGLQWNNRPNDLYHLTHFLSDQREGELNWQVIDVDKRPVDDLLTTPVAYMSLAPGSFDLNGDQQAKLKQYLDLGGMIVLNPEGASASVRRTAEQFFEAMYPQLKFRNLEAEHPVFRSWYQLTPKDGKGMRGLSNGARELVIVNGVDWGLIGRGGGSKAANDTTAKMAQNVFALATDKGALNNRLVERVLRQKGEAASEVTIGRAKYNGNWLPEPGAWDMQSRFMVNSAKVGVKTQDIELANINGSGVQVVHLAGTREVTLSEAELAAVVNFTRAGGTVILETVGGHGNFARAVEKQLEGAFSQPAVELASNETLLSGKGIQGASDVTRVTYRRHAIVSMQVKGRPRLAAFYVNDRPAVIVSNEDLTLGMLGVDQWGVLGYSKDSARKIMANIVLRAQGKAAE